MKVHAVLIGCLLVVAACEQDHHFETHARYSAPVGGFDLTIDAAGIVRAGADISEQSTATVTITSWASSSGRIAPLRLEVTRRPLTQDASVVKAAREAGFTPSEDESAELEHAVGGALSGPKGTVMDGQTHALRVIDVTFVR